MSSERRLKSVPRAKRVRYDEEISDIDSSDERFLRATLEELDRKKRKRRQIVHDDDTDSDISRLIEEESESDVSLVRKPKDEEVIKEEDGDVLSDKGKVESTKIKLKCWMVTLFLFSKEDVEKWFDQHSAEIEQACACTDKAPSTGTFHIHLLVNFRNKVSFKQWKEWFPGEPCRFEKARNGYQVCRRYVLGQVDGHREFKITIFDFNPPIKPKSTTQRFWELVQGCPQVPFVKDLLRRPEFAIMIPSMNKAFEFCRIAPFSVDMDHPRPIVVFFYGEPGSGKSYLAHRLARKWPSVCSCSFSPSGQLVNVNDQDECILFDDFPAALPSLSHEFVFKLFQPYPFIIDVKGSSRIYSPKVVIVTRCERYTDWSQVFGWKLTEQIQICRRVRFTVKCKKVAKTGVVNPQLNNPDDWTYESFVEELNEAYDENKMFLKF